jgi:hypothetical protein
MREPMPFVNPRDTSVFADIANIYGLPATEEFARGILSALDLKMTPVICGRLNAIISGTGNLSTKRRNAFAMKFLADPNASPAEQCRSNQSPVGVSGKREYFNTWPETFNHFGPQSAKSGV